MVVVVDLGIIVMGLGGGEIRGRRWWLMKLKKIEEWEGAWGRGVAGHRQPRGVHGGKVSVGDEVEVVDFGATWIQESG